MTLGVEEAIKYLEELAVKLESFPSAVGFDSMMRIPYPHTTSESGHGVTRIVSSGRGIAFEEFGAGFDADTYTDEGFYTEPGIWSQDHKQTFQNWNRDPSMYPYNVTPTRYMRTEAERLPSAIIEKAREYFNVDQK